MRELEVSFTVDGRPRTKGRPRFGKGRAYTPTPTTEAEQHIGWTIKNAYPGLQPDANGLYRIVARFYQDDLQRRDLDNMIKLVSDACTGIVWEDDAQVTAIDAQLERGADDPRSEVTLQRIADNDPAVVYRDCARCGVTFRVYPSTGKRKYCSMDCSARSQRKRETVVCAHCEAPFAVVLSRFARGAPFYCSTECRNESGRGAASCAVCGEKFTAPNSWRNKRRTCSRKCAGQLAANTRKRGRGTCADCGGPTSKASYTRCRKCHTKVAWSDAQTTRMAGSA